MLIATLSFAQESIFLASYSPAIATGSNSTFIAGSSWRGVNFEHRQFITALTSVGAGFGWQVFNKQMNNHTEYFDNGFLHGNQYRYINAYTIMLTSHYHLFPEKYFRPYFGGGFGVVYLNRAVEMGLYSSTQHTWNFGLAPEAGILYDMTPELNLHAAIVLNHAFNSNESDGYGAFHFKMGVVWVRL